MFTMGGMVKMLLNATNDNIKCTEPPKHVQMNAVFLIEFTIYSPWRSTSRRIATVW